MRYYQGDVERLAPKIRKEFYQRSTLQVTANRQQWCLNQAKAGDTSGFVGLHAVDVQRTSQLKPRVAVAMRIFPSIRFCAERRCEMKCPMFLLLQIFQRSRDAIARQDARAERHPPAETLVAPGAVAEHELGQPAVAAGMLVAEVFTFGDIIERMLEVLLVVLVGVSLASYLSVRGIAMGLIVMVVIRPVSVYLTMLGSEATRLQRGLIGWFGIRGIGSLYYLAFATRRLPHGALGSSLGELVLSAVAVSVVVHGLTAQSLMTWYEPRIGERLRKRVTP